MTGPFARSTHLVYNGGQVLLGYRMCDLGAGKPVVFMAMNLRISQNLLLQRSGLDTLRYRLLRVDNCGFNSLRTIKL